MNRTNEKQTQNHSLLDSKAENLVYKYLKELLDTDSYTAIPQQLLSKTFRIDFRDVAQEFRAYANIYGYQTGNNESLQPTSIRFDFVICNQKNFPVLILEVNGTCHEKSKDKFYDSFKQFMCSKYGFTLITLKLYQSYDDEAIRTMLLNKLKEHNHPLAINCYCPQCDSKLKFFITTQHRKIMQCNFCKNNAGNHKGFNLNEDLPKFFNSLLRTP